MKEVTNIDDFGTKDTYKLYRSVYEIIHPAISKRNISNYIYLKSVENNLIKVDVNEIIYVEIFSHYLIYHLENREIKVRGTISEAENNLSNYYFSRISKSFLINLKHVINIKLDNVLLTGNIELIISRLRKKDFLEAFYKYLGGGLK